MSSAAVAGGEPIQTNPCAKPPLLQGEEKAHDGEKKPPKGAMLTDRFRLISSEGSRVTITLGEAPGDHDHLPDSAIMSTSGFCQPAIQLIGKGLFVFGVKVRWSTGDLAAGA